MTVKTYIVFVIIFAGKQNKLLKKKNKIMAAILNFEYGCDKHIRANGNIDFVIPQTITFPKMYSFPYLQTYLLSLTVKLTTFSCCIGKKL